VGIAAKFPFMCTDDLAGAGYGGPFEGWLDPYSLMQAFRRKAIQVRNRGLFLRTVKMV
jgi:sarcosine oxidase